MEKKLAIEIYSELGELFAALKVGMLRHHRACDSDGLTSLRFGALGILSKMGALPSSELARLLRISKSQATALVDSLVENGNAERLQSEADRRVVEVRITKEGRKALDRRLDEAYSHMAEKLDRLDGEELVAIRTSLRTLTSILNKLEE